MENDLRAALGQAFDGLGAVAQPLRQPSRPGFVIGGGGIAGIDSETAFEQAGIGQGVDAEVGGASAQQVGTGHPAGRNLHDLAGIAFDIVGDHGMGGIFPGRLDRAGDFPFAVEIGFAGPGGSQRKREEGDGGDRLG